LSLKSDVHFKCRKYYSYADSAYLYNVAHTFIRCSPSGLLRFNKNRNSISAINRVGTYRMMLLCTVVNVPVNRHRRHFRLWDAIAMCDTYRERHSRKSVLIDGFKCAMYIRICTSIYDENVRVHSQYCAKFCPIQ